jgi:hypothetical protein
MTVKELVLSIKNQPGELARIIGHLYQNDVKVPAFWVGTDNKKATLRCITSDPKAAMSVLTGLGCKVKTTDVIAAQVPNHPGALNSILKLLEKAKINIRHIYPSLETENPILILDVDKKKQAIKVLENNWIKLCDEKVYHI